LISENQKKNPGSVREGDVSSVCPSIKVTAKKGGEKTYNNNSKYGGLKRKIKRRREGKKNGGGKGEGGKAYDHQKQNNSNALVEITRRTHPKTPSGHHAKREKKPETLKLLPWEKKGKVRTAT